jgi:prephenate dehydrogenase
VIERLTIVGLGLMGGSLGLAARERAGVGRIVGFDPDATAREAALERGCVDEAGDDLAAAVAGAELVVLCAPVHELPAVLAELAELAPEATVTDIGSTKAGVVAAVPAALRRRFIGGHPLCGMETRGAQNARAELFEGATWYLTPLADTEPARLRDLHRLLAALGAVPVAIDAGVHDRLLAVTSHLPHALANLLVVQAGEARIDGHDPLTSIGGSFRDMTRVAGANPRIWVDIFIDNRDALAAALREHQRALGEVLTALEAGDAGYLARCIGQASGHRRRSLAAQFDQRPEELYRVQVHISDRPGALAGITQTLGAARINIEDFELHHFTPERGGTMELLVAGQEAAERAVELLDGQGYGALAAPVLADADTADAT